MRFEASGGLINSSLVMQDKETDSYWSIMEGESIAGEFDGTKLKELPVTHKVRWKDWVALHPETLILSLNGREDVRRNVYDEYLKSDQGFRGARAVDKRLKTKLIIQIHDELLFEVPEEELDAVRSLVVDLMENAIPLSVPLVVNVATGRNWREAK